MVIRAAWGRGGGRQREQSIPAVQPSVPYLEPKNSRPRPGSVAFIMALLAVGVGLAVKKWREDRKQRADEEYERRRWGQESALEVSYAQSPLEAKEYNLALARTRQAMAVHRAIQYMNFGSPARAIVEVQRALQENSTARCPVLSAQYDGEDMNRLYRLHLENTEMPAKYSVLLQLREMLDIKEADAEKLEQEVLGSSSSFSI
ncbi:g6324 [Coccomyxa elongata]